MKKWIPVLCMCISLGALAACNGKEVPASQPEESLPASSFPAENSYESQMDPESKEEFPAESLAEVSQPQESSIQSSPAHPYPHASLVIRVLDKQGNPVQNVTGVLELGVASEDSAPPGIGLEGLGQEGISTGEDGKLYVTQPLDFRPKECSVQLSALFDSTMKQTIPLELNSSAPEITVTWTQGTPPAQKQNRDIGSMPISRFYG